MARVFIDGFESGDLGLWDNIIGSPTVDSGISGMDGTYCVNLTSNTQSISTPLPAADEYYLAFLYKPTYETFEATLVFFLNGSTVLGSLCKNTATNGNTLKIRRGNEESGTILATGTAVFNLNTVNLIEVRYKPHTSTGVFQVKVNGVLDIDFSGQTASSILQINRFSLGRYGAAGYAYGYFDNVVVDNSNFPGNTKIQAIMPASAGNSTQWTPSSGSNWDCVEETPPSDSDYNYTNTNDMIDLFTFQDLSGSIESIKCVQVQARAKYEGAPTPTKLQLGVRRSSTNYFSGSKDLTTAFKQHFHLWEQDPSTSAAWTTSGVNAAEFGYKAVSS